MTVQICNRKVYCIHSTETNLIKIATSVDRASRTTACVVHGSEFHGRYFLSLRRCFVFVLDCKQNKNISF